MRALITVLVGVLASALACDFAPEAGGDFDLSPEPQRFIDEPHFDESAWRYGTVEWSQLETDCPGEAWRHKETAAVLVERDRVTMVFETMPSLTGTLTGERATVSGIQTFPGSNGAEVTCIVDGTTSMIDGAMEGRMHEALSSDGDLNCDSRAYYRLTFDP